MEDCRSWVFPKCIHMEDVPLYIEKLNAIPGDEVITFDLQNTTRMHSSFIGFLIHSKNHMAKNGGRLVLVLSLTIEKILVMLNLNDYFTSDNKPSVKKSA